MWPRIDRHAPESLQQIVRLTTVVASSGTAERPAPAGRRRVRCARLFITVPSRPGTVADAGDLRCFRPRARFRSTVRSSRDRCPDSDRETGRRPDRFSAEQLRREYAVFETASVITICYALRSESQSASEPPPSYVIVAVRRYSAVRIPQRPRAGQQLVLLPVIADDDVAHAGSANHRRPRFQALMPWRGSARRWPLPRPRRRHVASPRFRRTRRRTPEVDARRRSYP